MYESLSLVDDDQCSRMVQGMFPSVNLEFKFHLSCSFDLTRVESSGCMFIGISSVGPPKPAESAMKLGVFNLCVPVSNVIVWD